MAACLALSAAPLRGQDGTVREAGLATVVTAAEPARLHRRAHGSLRPSLRTRVALYAGGRRVGRGRRGPGGTGRPFPPHAAQRARRGVRRGRAGRRLRERVRRRLHRAAGRSRGRAGRTGGWFVEAGIGGGRAWRRDIGGENSRRGGGPRGDAKTAPGASRGGASITLPIRFRPARPAAGPPADSNARPGGEGWRGLPRRGQGSAR